MQATLTHLSLARSSKLDALVVGGSINDRLALREQLGASGYRVTLESSLRRALTRLGQHRFAVCTLDLEGVAEAALWRRRFSATCHRVGTTLREDICHLAG